MHQPCGLRNSTTAGGEKNLRGFASPSYCTIMKLFPLSVGVSAISTPSLPLTGAVFDATSQMDTLYCTRLLPGRYKRASVPISQPIALDDDSPAAITAMTDSTTAYMQSSPEWADIRAWITTHFA